MQTDDNHLVNTPTIGNSQASLFLQGYNNSDLKMTTV